MVDQPKTSSETGDRQFSCFPAAVLAIILNDQEQTLMLTSKVRPDQWEVVSGALEANETVLDGVLREINEELGDDIQVQPVGVIHAQTFPYDRAIPDMISIVFVIHYKSGRVQPGDDMADSGHQWFDLSELITGNIDIIVPSGQFWLFKRAVETFRLWKDSPVDLQFRPRD